jgi:hypothetical protein
MSSPIAQTSDKKRIKNDSQSKSRTYTLEEFKQIFNNGINTIADELYEQSRRK